MTQPLGFQLAILAMAVSLHAKGELRVPTLTKMAMADEEVRVHGKEASDYARRLAEELMKRSSSEVQKMAHTFDEHAFLEASKGFLEREYNCIVEVHGAGEHGADPQHKARQAAPGRPAIIVE